MYSAWTPTLSVVLMASLAACNRAEPLAERQSIALQASATLEPLQRQLVDVARGREWSLSQTGLVLKQNGSEQSQVIALPDWAWAYPEFAGCLPDLALGPRGDVIVTTNVAPIVWRVDAQSLAVTRHPLALSDDRDRDVGFTGLVYAAEQDAYFAVSAPHGSLWRIDPQLRQARKLMLSEPLRGACAVRVQPSGHRVTRILGLCVRTADDLRSLAVSPDQRSAYLRPEPCRVAPVSADVAFAR
jgi:hypothetical protein